MNNALPKRAHQFFYFFATAPSPVTDTCLFAFFMFQMSEYFISKSETFYHCLSRLALMIFWIFSSTVATFYWDCSWFQEAMLTGIRAYYGLTCVTGRAIKFDIDLSLVIWSKILLLKNVMAVCVIGKQTFELSEITITSSDESIILSYLYALFSNNISPSFLSFYHWLILVFETCDQSNKKTVSFIKNLRFTVELAKLA